MLPCINYRCNRDRHKSGIYQNKDFLEITASSLNKSGSKGKETDPLLIENISDNKLCTLI